MESLNKSHSLTTAIKAALITLVAVWTVYVLLTVILFASTTTDCEPLLRTPALDYVQARQCMRFEGMIFAGLWFVIVPMGVLCVIGVVIAWIVKTRCIE